MSTHRSCLIELSRYRVYDCTVRPRARLAAHVPPSDDAMYRVFVTADSVKRAYKFAKRYRRELDAELLSVMLRQSEYLARESFHARTHGR